MDIRGDITPSLHPRSLAGEAEALGGDDPRGQAVLSHARRAFEKIYGTIATIQDVESEIANTAFPAPPGLRQKVERKPVPGQALRHGRENDIAEAAQKPLAEARRAADAAVARLQRAEEEIDQEIAAALTQEKALTPAELALAGEVRAHIKDLPADKRAAFLSGAIAAGDRLTVAAALKGPAYLAGIDDRLAANLRRRAGLEFAPRAARQKEAVARILKRLALGQATLAEKQAALEAKRNPLEAAAARQTSGSLDRLVG